MTARIVLENKSIFVGRSFGYESRNGSNTSLGEIVFNTSMTGYQEIITDPSYNSQIVVMTYPLIGNYGINNDDVESKKAQISGLIVREYEDFYSNYKATSSLGDYLKANKIVGVKDIDTRCLARQIREHGALRGIIAIGDEIDGSVLEKMVFDYPLMEGRSLVEHVSTNSTYTVGIQDSRHNIVLIDYGVKTNILRRLSKRSCFVHVVPASSTCEYILSLKPDAILLSNGPGDPASLTNSINTIEKLIKTKKPIFGICLGHQLLCLALGAKTYKMKFGHHGANHSVKNILTNKIEITSQNHGFAVVPNSLAPEVKVSHFNINDLSIEGIAHSKLPVFSIQYHPESSPGPNDSDYLFDEFIDKIK